MKIKWLSIQRAVWIGFLIVISCTSSKLHMSSPKTRQQVVVNSFPLQAEPVIKDKETAIAVAEPMLFRKFGRKNIQSQRPYKIVQIDHHWIIQGALPEDNDGGVFEITLDAYNRRIIKMSHDQ
jgi:hypothetical protein